MAEIEIKVSGAVARVVRKPEVITAGTVGLTAAFTFDAGWDGLSKTAVFSAGNVTRDVVGIGTGPVAVPHEVLAVPMRELLAGVYGVNADGTRATPTIWARVDQIRPGANPSGDEGTDPSLDVWAQIMAMVGDPAQLETEAKESLVAAVNELAARSGGTADPEDVKAIVEAYLAANPPVTEESDPTVPAWAKQPQKPIYTAAEVGALPADTVIPVVPSNVSAFENDAGYLTEHQDLSGKLDASELPTAINTALAQAKASGEFDGKDGEPGSDYILTDADKAEIAERAAEMVEVPGSTMQPLTFTGAVEATYDGSEAVSVEIPSVGSSAGNSGDTPVEILTFTTEEEVTALTLDIDSSFFDVLSKYKVLEFCARINKSTTQEYTAHGTLTATLTGRRSSDRSLLSQLKCLAGASCVPRTDLSYISYCDVSTFMPKGATTLMVMGTTHIHFQNQNPVTTATAFARYTPNDIIQLELTSSINMGVGSTFKLVAWGSLE